MRAPAIKLSRRASAITLATITALTVGADIAVATGGAGIAAVGSHHTSVADEQQYLRGLRPVAARIYAAVTPVQQVLDKVAEPKVGDDWSARDALARGDSLAHLRAARRALARLQAPTPLRARQSAMLHSTGEMVQALQALRKLRNNNNPSVIDQVTSIGSSGFAGPEHDYSVALRAAFRAGRLPAPRGFDAVHLHPPVSQTGWIFGADRACGAAVVQLTGLTKYRDLSSLSNVEARGRLWMHALSKAGHAITSLPKPHGGSALPRTLRTRLHLLSYGSQVFARQLSALQQRSISLFTKASGQIHDVLPSLRALGSAMRSYGAVNCGEIIRVWGSAKRAPTSSSSTTHHHHALST